MLNRRSGSSSVRRHHDNHEDSQYVTPTKSVHDYEYLFDVPKPKRLRQHLYGFSSLSQHYWDESPEMTDMFPCNLLPSFEQDLRDVSIPSCDLERKRLNSFNIIKIDAVYSECSTNCVDGGFREIRQSPASSNQEENDNEGAMQLSSSPTGNLKRHQAIEAIRKR
jgi:hypothetical protein